MDSKTKKMAIFAPNELSYPFEAFGFDKYPCHSGQEVGQKFLEMRKSGELTSYAIIFVLEEYLQQMDPEIYERVTQNEFPAITPLPGQSGATGFAKDRIQESIRRAIGTDLGV